MEAYEEVDEPKVWRLFWFSARGLVPTCVMTWNLVVLEILQMVVLTKFLTKKSGHFDETFDKKIRPL